MFKIILPFIAAAVLATPAQSQDAPLAQDFPLALDAPQAQDAYKRKRKVKRVVEPIPAASTANLYRVSADRTPSGFVVPRFVSLKFSKVNGRTGPSRDHPIAWQYQRRGLPLLIVAETEMWRKVRDISGDEAWVRKPALSGARTVIAKELTSVRSRPNASAREIARIDQNALLRLEACKDGWCEVKSESGLKGWSRQDMLWGAKRP